MNTALIFAGGTGSRMNSKTLPKQFLEVNGKPIIIHTLEYFEKNTNIDYIAVVCIKEWIEYLEELVRKHYIKKIKWIVPGGSNGQESIYNGLKAIHSEYGEEKDTVVLIHDGVRPLITDELITRNIESVRTFGSAITSVPQNETVVEKDENDDIRSINRRELYRIARAPQSFYLSDIWNVHNSAIRDNNLNMIDSASLMMKYGHKLHIIEGPVENIKITTPLDFYIFRAIFEAKENEQIFGL